jgi:prolyl-tRNA editing enzyme YbaK/EbsC (Cys-tRNA(Pro) deacylase)
MVRAQRRLMHIDELGIITSRVTSALGMLAAAVTDAASSRHRQTSFMTAATAVTRNTSCCWLLTRSGGCAALYILTAWRLVTTKLDAAVERQNRVCGSSGKRGMRVRRSRQNAGDAAA